jgi:hypothetical protein
MVETTVFSADTANRKSATWLADITKRFIPTLALEVVKETDVLLAKKGDTKLDTGQADFHLSF